MYRVVCLVAILVAGLAAAPAAFAQGFGVYEQGACMMARAGAGVASPCEDGSAVFFNPAGIGVGKKQQIGIGATLIRPSGDFTNDKDKPGQVSTLNTRNYFVPNIYFARRVNNRFAAGFGLFAPYGLTTDWPTTAEGRFLGYKSVVQGLYLQPTVAYTANEKVAFGGGIDITYMNVELRQRADLATVPITGTPYTFGNVGVPAGTDFADVRLTGNAWHAGYHLGMLVRFSEAVSAGVRYLGGQKVNINNGKVNYEQILTGQTLKVPVGPFPVGTPIDKLVEPQFAEGAKLSDQGATTSLPLPAQLVLGTAFKVAPKAKLLIDYQFVRWSKFDKLVVDQEIGDTLTTVESYRDTHGFRFGFDYAVGSGSAVRAGFLFHPPAAPDQTVTPNLPEAARREVTVGFGTKLGGKLILDFAYQYLYQQDRRGRSTNGGMAVPTADVNNGVYHFKGHLFGLTFGF